MGKIRLKDLARTMGVPEQDLMFKMKSIGVRLEGDDPEIDSDIIQAILQGKRLPQPREVILRDSAQTPTPTPQRQRSRPSAPPTRPPRGRTLIHRVEDRIREIPTKEKPPEAAPAAPEPVVEAQAPAATTEPAPKAPVKAKETAKPAAKPKPKEAPVTTVPKSAKARARIVKAAAAKPPDIKPVPPKKPKREPAAAPPQQPAARPAAAKPAAPKPAVRRPTPRPPVRPGRPSRLPPGLRKRRDPPMRRRRPRRPGDSGPATPSEPVEQLKPASARGHRRAQRREETP
ncbi:MAG: hypothetical protein AAF657_25195, partial [Acidobacteriota bacterium]